MDIFARGLNLIMLIASKLSGFVDTVVFVFSSSLFDVAVFVSDRLGFPSTETWATWFSLLKQVTGLDARSLYFIDFFFGSLVALFLVVIFLAYILDVFNLG